VCAKGSSCRFLHGNGASTASAPSGKAEFGVSQAAAPPASIDAMCKYHKEDSGVGAGCAKGQRCPFRHSKYDADEALRRRRFAPKVKTEPIPLQPPCPPPMLSPSHENITLESATASLERLGIADKNDETAELAELAFAAAENVFDDGDEACYFYGAAGAFASEPEPFRQKWSAVAAKNMPKDVLEDTAQQTSAQMVQHSGPKRVAAPRPVCAFFLQGDCKYGRLCRNAHPATAEFGEHDQGISESEPSSEELEECGICYEVVKGRFGLLTGCDHVFCIGCIRSWRKKGTENQGADAVRVCPICRAPSWFIVPSSVHMRGARKDALIESYKTNLASIPCKNYEYGVRECPFGGSCFYAHLNPEGDRAQPERPRIKIRADGETAMMGQISLSSFLRRS
jgi:hypothetical protein